MNLSLPSLKEGLAISSISFTPEVVITLSFHPVITPKSHLEQQLKSALKKAEAQILSKYSMQQALPVFIRLQNVVNNLNFYTHKKSIAIFVSPVCEKVIYLDFEVSDKVIIDKKFKLLDIAKNKMSKKDFLLLVLKNDCAALYVGNDQSLQLIKQDKLANKREVLPQRLHYPLSYLPLNAADQQLLQLDLELSQIMESHPYPVFVMGEEKTVEYFKFATANKHCIAAFNFLPAPGCAKENLAEAMQPHLRDWSKLQLQLLMRKIEKARCNKTLSWGSQNIWKAGKKKGSLLVAEMGYTYPNRKNTLSDNLYHLPLSYNHEFYITDAADEVAEKVLETGGNIQLVANDSLRQYAHLVMLAGNK
ncbi:hypothetical protein [Aridibaculum aurantiacum]|uniref:baeRF3 domain-containing protein n=1 Tax=Aridibaculum aurantiacum TaxID=2810307 RepID=UPI001A960437|nr:hypothetical protein [Aridibaculum aurantiacum]